MLLIVLEVPEARKKIHDQIEALVGERKRSHVGPHVRSIERFGSRNFEQRHGQIESNRPPALEQYLGMTPGSATDVENRMYLVSGQIRCDELDNVFCFTLIAV